MSTERRSLSEFIVALVAELDAADEAAARRLHHVTRGRSATIALDREAVFVTFIDETLTVTPTSPDGPPLGRTDSETVAALLDGTVEAHAAIINGRIEAQGTTEDVARIFVAIEIVLDASPRAPALQRLADEYRRAYARPEHARFARTAWYAFGPSTDEWRLLAELDLLP